MEGQRRADEILEVASRLFYERGYANVSTRALAQAVGIQGGSLYHHFSSKEEMLYRITRYGSREFFAGLTPLLSAEAPFAERLDRFVAEFLHRSWDRRYPISVLFSEGGNLTPEHAEELRVTRRRFQQAVQRFLAQGCAAGAFSVPDPKVAGIAVLDMLNGVDRWMRTSGRLGIGAVATTYGALVRQMVGAGGATRAATPGPAPRRKATAS